VTPHLEQQIAELVGTITHDHERQLLLELLQALRDSQAASEFLEPVGNSPEQARSLLEKAITVGLPSWLAWHRHGLALKRLGRVAEAIPSYQKSISLNPDRNWHSSCHDLVDCYKLTERYEEGALYFEQLSSEHPCWWLPWHDRGVMGYHRDESLSEQTISHYLKAIEYYHDEPGWIWSSEDLKNYLHKHDAIRRGQEVFKTLTSEYAEYWILWHNRAWFEMKLGPHQEAFYQEAIASYQKAIDKNPKGGWFWSWKDLGDIFFNVRGNFTGAAESFNKAIIQAPKTSYHSSELGHVWSAWKGLADSLLALSRYQEAIDAYQQIMECGHILAKLHGSVGTCREKLDQLCQAFESYCQALALDPSLEKLGDARESIVVPLQRKLLAFLDKRFSLDELQTLCFHVNVDYENLPGESKQGMARELIRRQARISSDDYKQLRDLITEIAKMRQGVPLP
jgi:tetratricopeptide (TPR) repeat protein